MGPASMRARALAGALVAVPLSMVLGGPLCGWLLGIANPLGMEAWRYMFLAIAIPNVVLAFVAAIYMVDRPDKARWLTEEERDWLAREHEIQGGDAQAPMPSLAARSPAIRGCGAAALAGC